MSKLGELNKITEKLNKEARRANPDAPPVAFIAAGNEDLLDFGLIPTGNSVIDEALGGGFPRGTIVQVIGAEGTGKTCMAFDMIAYNQRIARERGEEFLTIYVHLEARAFPLLPALNAGVDLDSMIVVNALSSGEKTFDTLLRYLWDWDKRQARNLVDLVVIDSVTAAAPEAEMKSSEESLENITVGRHAAMMSKVLRIVSGSGALGRSLLVMINQHRTNVGSYGSPQVATGGKAMGYYPKISITMKKKSQGALTKGSGDNKIIVGHTIDGSVDKNNTQVGMPYAKFSYPVIYGEGVDLIVPVVDIAIRKGVITQTSSSRFEILFGGELLKFHGKERLEDKARGEEEFLNYLQSSIVAMKSSEATGSAPVISDEEPQKEDDEEI